MDQVVVVRALLLDRDLELTVGEREPVAPGPDDVVVRVAWAGVCGSDLHVLASGDWVEYWPATLGHEVAGVVAASSTPGLPVGTPVVVDSRIPCGDCDGCSRAARLCTRMAWLGERVPGGYAEQLTVPATSVHPVPADLELSIAVLAEPLAVVVNALDRVTDAPRSVLVLGHGPIGAFVAVEAARRWPGAPVTVVEPSPARAALAAPLATVVADHAELPEGSAFDLVVDAAGYPGSLTDALRYPTSGGTVLLVALSSKPATVVPSEVVERSVSVVGSVGFDTEHLHRAIAAIAAGPGEFGRLVTHRVPLAEVPEFLAAGLQRTAGKVVVDCGADA